MDEILAIESDYIREQKLIEVLDRAKQLENTEINGIKHKGIKSKFERLYKAKEREIKAIKKSEHSEYVPESVPDYSTNFSMLPEQYSCGDWIANDNGVRVRTEKGIATACTHPIIPTRILKNAETGKYKVELMFKIRNQIRTSLVDRDVIASPNKILKLANESVQVTSLTAPYLVQFLSDIESLNSDIITEHMSTSRLGWIDGIDEEGNKIKRFLPYDQEVVFDNELNTKALFDSIKTCGSRAKWYKTIGKIRAKQQSEVLINLAASFSSVLVEICGALPFIVSLWGGTGIGKSVILKIATSVWADPGEGKYITDAKATTTAMEIRLNILNSLPMTLDDMAQVKNQYDEDFSELIYRWCAGKGRDRSNVDLGLNKLTSWRNCTITNGERSLVDESTQGGAVNRVIDIESSGETLFDGKSGNDVVNCIESNFGYAGQEFIELVEELGFEEINRIMCGYYDQIKQIAESHNVEKEDKQIVPMALILTADELTEQHLFKDGIRLNIEKCVSYLKNKGEVSEHKRAYEYLVGMIAANNIHFADNDGEETSGNIETWGYYKDKDTIVINGMIFDRIMKQAGFQTRAFLSWAKKLNLLETDAQGNPKKVVSVKGNKFRAVIIRTNYELENLDFTDVSESEDIPFE